MKLSSAPQPNFIELFYSILKMASFKLKAELTSKFTSLSLSLSILFLPLVYFILFHFVSLPGPLCQNINLLFYFKRLSIATQAVFHRMHEREEIFKEK